MSEINLCCFLSVFISVNNILFTPRISWKLWNSVKSLSEPWAWGLYWLSEAAQEPCIQTLAVPMYNFSQHNGSLSCNDLFLVGSPWPFRALLILISNFYRSYRCRNSQIMYKISTSLLLNTSRVSTYHFVSLCTAYLEVIRVFSHDYVTFFRFFWHSGHSDNGASGEVNNDTLVQVGFLSRQLWWWAQRSDSAETDPVTFIHEVTDVDASTSPVLICVFALQLFELGHSSDAGCAFPR